MTALFNRASLIALAAALGAATGVVTQACAQSAPAAPVSEAPTPTASDSDQAPIQTLPPVNRRPDVGPVDSVQTTALPPPAAAPAPSAQPAYTPPPSPARAPKPEPTYTETVKGKVVEAKNKIRTIIVDDGDTVNILSARYLMTKEALIKANKLKKPYEIDAGQSLKIPTPKAYVVESGDTLFSIGKRFNVSADVLGELNNVDPKGRLRSGEQIVLPVGARDSGPIRHLIGGVREGGGYGQTPRYPVETPDNGYHVAPPVRGLTPPTTPPSEAPTPPSDADVAAAGRGRFLWPVSGQLLTTFGPKPGGQRNDGVDIAAPAGTMVTAAAAGYVVYAGDKVPGFGNLVLIQHEGGWVTAYAHLSTTTVKIKDRLAQGDPIGEVGQTGGVAAPELYFEIRYRAHPGEKPNPIDPSLVLPRP
jgi:murein DD-endopeptidase MepM/ murein hydrolase activator NlpD